MDSALCDRKDAIRALLIFVNTSSFAFPFGSRIDHGMVRFLFSDSRYAADQQPSLIRSRNLSSGQTYSHRTKVDLVENWSRGG